MDSQPVGLCLFAEGEPPENTHYSGSSIIRTSIIRTLDYLVVVSTGSSKVKVTMRMRVNIFVLFRTFVMAKL